MILKPQLFFKILIMFAGTMALGIFTAYKYSFSLSVVPIPNFKLSPADLVSAVFLILFLVLSFKYKRAGNFLFNLLLIFIVFGGAQFVSGGFLIPPLDFLFAVSILLFFIIVKNVFMHNLGVMLGIAGIGALAGLSVSPVAAVFFLAVLSFYDILAVYKTKHMIELAKKMIGSGAVFGFLIPTDFKGFFYNKKEAHMQAGNQFMILGSGDTAVPLILASSLAKTSLTQAVIVGLFSLAGLFVTHLIFVNQKKRAPMAALPPIATMTLIGYLITLL